MAEPTAWTDDLRRWVESKQERAYRNLGPRLGVGWDADKACQLLSRTPNEPMPSESVKDLPGWDSFTPAQREAFDEQVRRSYLDALDMELPTRFEDRSRYPVIRTIFENVVRRLDAYGISGDAAPLLATLPSGDVNARVSMEPRSGVSVLFFEQGLFQFLFDFATLCAWMSLPLGPSELASDSVLAKLPRRHTMPWQASELFTRALHGYVASGTPLANPISQRAPADNLWLSVVLNVQMQQFVLAHELAHVKLGHLRVKEPDRETSWEQEYEADMYAATFVMARAAEQGLSPAVGYWGCDIALSCVHLLHLGIAVMEFGGKPDWTSKTHPDALSRRRKLRALVSHHADGLMPPAAIAAVKELLGMSDALYTRLGEMGVGVLLASRAQGTRPSHLWAPFLSASVAAPAGAAKA